MTRHGCWDAKVWPCTACRLDSAASEPSWKGGDLSFCDPDIEWDGTNLFDGKLAGGHEAIVELYTVRGGKVVYRKGFSDPDEALEAVGLSEQAAHRRSS
jgi:hypothetical protein